MKAARAILIVAALLLTGCGQSPDEAARAAVACEKVGGRPMMSPAMFATKSVDGVLYDEMVDCRASY
ncbi:MAG TPA: hypothetical protein DEQ40_00390 [Oxalobacteraceae bacterium]|jgi:hypothetical protein|nr:hypothetical protein [Oxalobacteraceae bacterium]